MFGYFVLGLILVVMIRDTVNQIRQKKWLRVLGAVFMLPMLAFFAAEGAYGGSAAKDAATQYVGYIPGHFYVMEHGNYTEVSAAVFRRMQALETVAYISFAAGLVCNMLSFLIGKTDK